MKSNNVIIFGTFDVLHPGHLKLIQFANKLGEVTVVLTPDSMCKKYKGLNPVNNYEAREERLKKMKWIANVMPADTQANTYSIIKKTKPDTIVLGYDQINLKPNIVNRLKELHLEANILIANPYRPEIYKSSKFRNQLPQLT